MSGTAFLQLNGVRVVSGHVSIPYYGTWTADVMAPNTGNATGLTLGSPVTLTLGNLSLVGAAYRVGPFAGQLRVRCVGGYGGWQRTVDRQQYALSGGVRLSTVLGDLARAVGETVNLATDSILGSGFVRENAPAARILRQVAGPLWYVDPQGVTQVRPSRPALTVSSAFLINRYDGDRGELEISTEDYLSWLPGSTFSNELLDAPATISLSTIDTDNDGTLRFTVLTVGPPTDRLVEDIRALVRDELENYTFHGVYSYAVQATDGVTVDLQPTSTTIPLPALRKVTLRSGVPGTKIRPGLGALCAVSFLNGDPTQYIVDPLWDTTPAQAIAFQGGNLGAARAGFTLPPGEDPITPPWLAPGVPTGDPVILAFTALDSGGQPATTTTQPTLSPPPSLWDGMSPGDKAYYPATTAGLTAAITASATCVPTGLGAGAVYGFIAKGSQTVTVGD